MGKHVHALLDVDQQQGGVSAKLPYHVLFISEAPVAKIGSPAVWRLATMRFLSCTGRHDRRRRRINPFGRGRLGDLRDRGRTPHVVETEQYLRPVGSFLAAHDG
jgi:hypothetical protein